MTERALTDREITLLRIVAEGKRSTKEIDIIFSVRHGPAMVGPVMHDLRQLGSVGFVDFDPNTGGFGSWAVTPNAQRYLDRA